MTMGPAPMMRMEVRSVRLGMARRVLVEAGRVGYLKRQRRLSIATTHHDVILALVARIEGSAGALVRCRRRQRPHDVIALACPGRRPRVARIQGSARAPGRMAAREEVHRACLPSAEAEGREDSEPFAGH